MIGHKSNAWGGGTTHHFHVTQKCKNEMSFNITFSVNWTKNPWFCCTMKLSSCLHFQLSWLRWWKTMLCLSMIMMWLLFLVNDNLWCFMPNTFVVAPHWLQKLNKIILFCLLFVELIHNACLFSKIFVLWKNLSLLTPWLLLLFFPLQSKLTLPPLSSLAMMQKYHSPTNCYDKVLIVKSELRVWSQKR